MPRVLSLALLLSACATDADPASTGPADQAPLPAGLQLDVDERNGELRFQVSGLNPFETVSIAVASPRLGTGQCIPGVGCLDILGRPSLVGQAQANGRGTAVLREMIPTTVPPGTRVGFQAVAPRGAASVGSDPVIYTVSDGLVELQVVHAGADAPAVDVYANGSLLLSDVSFGDASPIIEVPAGTYALDLRNAGASTIVSPVFSTTVDLAADEAYTVVATGLLNPSDPVNDFRLLALEQDWGAPAPDAARVRILHASPDAPTVALDVFSDGLLDVPTLDRYADTGPEGVALPSDRPFGITVATPAGDAVTSLSFPALPEGGELTVLALGQLGEAPSQDASFRALVLFDDGTTAIIEQDPTVYVLHASPDAPPVDVRAGGTTLISNLGYRELSAPVQVPPGSYDLEIAPDIFTALGLPGLSFSTPELQAGERYLVTATGFVNTNATGEPFQLLYTPDTFSRDFFTPRIQALHASPDAPAVDIGYFDVFNPSIPDFFSAFLFDVPFGASTTGPGVELWVSAIDFGVRVTGDPVPAFRFAPLSLGFDGRSFVVATGSIAQDDFGLTLVDATTSPWTATTVPGLHP